uniref:Uncharacterized protein n=1 Tax=Oryzias latipes TaxID=8090 RepID=A0A3B3IB02_ORYLA
MFGYGLQTKEKTLNFKKKLNPGATLYDSEALPPSPSLTPDSPLLPFAPLIRAACNKFMKTFFSSKYYEHSNNMHKYRRLDPCMTHGFFIFSQRFARSLLVLLTC